MQSEGTLHINLAQASAQAECLQLALNDTYFSSLDQDEIVGGNVVVKIRVKPAVGQIYAVKVEVEGEVTVLCDRCLDPLVIPVGVADEVKVKDGEEEDSDAWDMKYAEGCHSAYDLSWDVYEIIETSLPMQRVHPEGGCNADMLSRIMHEEDGAGEFLEED